jgi:hypothetical protein
LQGSLGSVADHAGLFLRERGTDVQFKILRVGHVAGNEFHPGFHKIGDEGEVAAEPIELGYDEGGFALSTQGKCFIEPWA